MSPSTRPYDHSRSLVICLKAHICQNLLNNLGNSLTDSRYKSDPVVSWAIIVSRNQFNNKPLAEFLPFYPAFSSFGRAEFSRIVVRTKYPSDNQQPYQFAVFLRAGQICKTNESRDWTVSSFVVFYSDKILRCMEIVNEPSHSIRLVNRTRDVITSCQMEPGTITEEVADHSQNSCTYQKCWESGFPLAPIVLVAF